MESDEGPAVSLVMPAVSLQEAGDMWHHGMQRHSSHTAMA